MHAEVFAYAELCACKSNKIPFVSPDGISITFGELGIYDSGMESYIYRDMNSFLKVKGFSLLHQNIRGLIGKKDLISNLLFTHHKIDILSLSETFISSLENNTKIGSYTFESKNCDNGIGGGIGAYIRDGIRYTRREDLECKELELMWIETSFKNAKKFLVGVSTPGFVKIFEQKLSQNVFCLENNTVSEENGVPNQHVLFFLTISTERWTAPN